MNTKGPVQKGGVYNLIITLSGDRKIMVGRLGTFVFPKGFYVYTGSARNGLERRINRHLSSNKKFHWHIDYLLFYAKITKVLRYVGGEPAECELNRVISHGAGAMPIVKKFGSSDCNCVTHLYYFKKIPEDFPECGQEPPAV